MPNHVITVIKARPHVIGYLLDDEWNVDFNRVLPTPALPFERDFEYVGQPHSGPMRPPDISSLRSRDKAIGFSSTDATSILAGYINKVMTGHNSRYSANCSIWGTKWNAYETGLSPDGTILKFKTAWNHPVTVITALSNVFPEERIEVLYGDEDIGENCGHYDIWRTQIRNLQTHNNPKYPSEYWMYLAAQLWNVDHESYFGINLWETTYGIDSPPTDYHQPFPHGLTTYRLSTLVAPISHIDIDDETDLDISF